MPDYKCSFKVKYVHSALQVEKQCEARLMQAYLLGRRKAELGHQYDFYFKFWLQ